jgi:hypothetical protein
MRPILLSLFLPCSASPLSSNYRRELVLSSRLDAKRLGKK